jgi:hypothetical protein
MLTKIHIDKMFIRQELTDEQARRADEIEQKAHELALLIQKNCGRPNNMMEESILHLKQAAMLARCCIAQEDRHDY